MTAGTHVLVARVQSIVPVNWKRKSLVLHSFFTVLRCIIGVIDVGLIHIENYPDGSCKYIDEEFWGPVYTLYDTFIDVYVTVVISCVLITHIRSLVADRMKVNKNLYTSVIYHNVFRTVCLTIVNLISAIFIIMQGQEYVIMLLWPIINIFFVVLVGYDSDVTKSIRKLRQKRWRTLPTTTTSTVDLGRIPSISIPTKIQTDISTSLSDVELNMDVPDTNKNSNNHNSYNNNNNNSNNNNNNNNSDLSLIQLELWKSRLSSTEQKIQEQAGYDAREDKILSLPNFQNRGSASYDTDNTLT
ncbi:hypothetical protein BD770DRAFT_324830 [Pilaira anomala]|nr:hypothetical protein BD770DRAFT_324830 [Pilaira anomala]